MASEMDADFFRDILESNKDMVRDGVRDALMDSIKRQFQWELPKAVKVTVKEFMEQEVVPAIRAELLANKEQFVEAATEIARAAPAEIAKAMQAKIAENLTHSWTLREVVTKLVG